MVRKHSCFYCGGTLSRKKATRDHVIPRAHGGTDSRKNIVHCCHQCNRDKGCLTVDEFRVVMAYRMGVLKCPKLFNFPGETKKY